MKKKIVVLGMVVAMMMGVTACGEEATTTEATTAEATTVATVTEAVTEEETTEVATASEAEPEVAVEDSVVDADGNLVDSLFDNDVEVEVTAKVVNGSWYVNDDYKNMGKIVMYNVPTKEDAYSNSPRISLELWDQETIDYYAGSRENVADIDSITINDVEYTGTTYTQYGMEWTEYITAVEGTEEFLLIRISDVDVTAGEGNDVLNSIAFSVK